MPGTNEGVGLFAGFIWGGFGVFIAELLVFWKIRFQPNKLRYLLTRKYYVIAILMALVAGTSIDLYLSAGCVFNPYVCIQLGITTPLLIASGSSFFPKLPGRTDK